MWKWLTVAACVITTGAALAADQKHDGNELIHQCRPVPATGKYIRGNQMEAFKTGQELGRCQGLISAYAEEMNFAGKICIPDDVTYGQVWRVVKKYLDDNPTLLHKHRSTLIKTALVEAWPCK